MRLALADVGQGKLGRYRKWRISSHLDDFLWGMCMLLIVHKLTSGCETPLRRSTVNRCLYEDILVERKRKTRRVFRVLFLQPTRIQRKQYGQSDACRMDNPMLQNMVPCQSSTLQQENCSIGRSSYDSANQINFTVFAQANETGMSYVPDIFSPNINYSATRLRIKWPSSSVVDNISLLLVGRANSHPGYLNRL
jgi:hypothetical protein